MRKAFLVFSILLVQSTWAKSEAEQALNAPSLLKEIRVEKGGIAQLEGEAKRNRAEGDLVLTFYCPKDSSKCNLQQVQVTERPLKK